MKHLILIFVAVSTLFTFSGCGSDSKKNNDVDRVVSQPNMEKKPQTLHVNTPAEDKTKATETETGLASLEKMIEDAKQSFNELGRQVDKAITPDIENAMDKLKSYLKDLEKKFDKEITPDIEIAKEKLDELEKQANEAIEPYADQFYQARKELEKKLSTWFDELLSDDDTDKNDTDTSIEDARQSLKKLERQIDKAITPDIENAKKKLDKLEKQANEAIKPYADQFHQARKDLEKKVDKEITPNIENAMDKLKSHLKDLEKKIDKEITPDIESAMDKLNELGKQANKAIEPYADQFHQARKDLEKKLSTWFDELLSDDDTENE